MIHALLKALELKDEKRTGQQLYSIEDPDSIADHSWSVAFLTMIYGEDLDMEKALKMSIVHDLAESKTGDIARRADEESQVDKEEKKEEEEKVFQEFSEELGADEILGLWKEFEEKESREAKFVKDMDHLESCLQALNKEKQGRYNPKDNKDMPYDNLDEFFLTSEGKFHTEKGKQLFRKIKSKYEKTKKGEEFHWEDEKLGLAYKALKLKDEKRTGWQLRGVGNPESVADHCWSSAFLCSIFSEEPSPERIKMALIHDLEQAVTGDIPSRVDQEKKMMSSSEKTRKELEAMKKLIPDELDELRDLWDEHLEMKTEDAVFVEDIEQIDMVLQALKYEKNSRYTPENNFSKYEKMDEFFKAADENIETVKGRRLFKKIKDRYAKVKQ